MPNTKTAFCENNAKSQKSAEDANIQTVNAFERKVDQSGISVCKILGVNIAEINMDWLLKFTEKNLEQLRGDFMCVVNVYSDVTGYNDPEFSKILNSSVLCMPDGGPLSTVGRRRGYKKMQRTTGPSYMGEIFKISAERGWKHSLTCY